MLKEFSKDSIVFEAKTLEEVYEKATKSFSCSITELDIDIIQIPTKGIFGLFCKDAIIQAKLKLKKTTEVINSKSENIKTNEKNKKVKVETLSSKLEELKNEEQSSNDEKTKEEVFEVKQVKKEKIFEDFYDRKEQVLHETPVVKKENTGIEQEIKKDINNLFSKLCYEIDEIQVKILDDNETIYIEFSGVDSALLIGKEGYRYKALSYILFNWLHEKYGKMLKLEVAQFLENQEKSIYAYLEPVIQTIKDEGFYKTKILDGVLVHIALTKLRDEFPDKYVAVKTTQKGDKYILVNEYRN